MNKFIIKDFSKPLSFALVGKFSRGRPTSHSDVGLMPVSDIGHMQTKVSIADRAVSGMNAEIGLSGSEMMLELLWRSIQIWNMILQLICGGPDRVTSDTDDVGVLSEWLKKGK